MTTEDQETSRTSSTKPSYSIMHRYETSILVHQKSGISVTTNFWSWKTNFKVLFSSEWNQMKPKYFRPKMTAAGTKDLEYLGSNLSIRVSVTKTVFFNGPVIFFRPGYPHYPVPPSGHFGQYSQHHLLQPTASAGLDNGGIFLSNWLNPWLRSWFLRQAETIITTVLSIVAKLSHFTNWWFFPSIRFTHGHLEAKKCSVLH